VLYVSLLLVVVTIRALFLLVYILGCRAHIFPLMALKGRRGEGSSQSRITESSMCEHQLFYISRYKATQVSFHSCGGFFPYLIPEQSSPISLLSKPVLTKPPSHPLPQSKYEWLGTSQRQPFASEMNDMKWSVMCVSGPPPNTSKPHFQCPIVVSTSTWRNRPTLWIEQDLGPPNTLTLSINLLWHSWQVPH
jgi:hypothetical protein